MQAGGTASPAMARLHQVLDRLLRGRVAVIAAPPGNDKFALVQAWLAEHPELPARWAHSPAELDQALEASEHESGLRAIVLASSSTVDDPAVASRAMDFADRHPEVRLVFVGRTRPSVPLGSLAARGLLVDIDSSELAWTRCELSSALTELTPALDDECLDRLLADSRGWPVVGRLLASQPLGPAHERKVVRLVDAFIDEEVLAGLDEDELALLQSVAALPAVDPAAAAWMTGRGEAAALLIRLQSRGVPISWEEGSLIRLNPMLRGRLRRGLSDGDPATADQANERAVLWLRHKGQELDAVRLAVEAGLVELAWLVTVELVTRYLHRAQLANLLPQLVDVLPASWAHEVLATFQRCLATPQTWIAQAETLDPRRLTHGTLTTRLAYATMLLAMSRAADYPSTVDLSAAVRTAEQVETRSVDELDQAVLAGLRTEHGLWLLHQGRLVESQQVLLQALGTARTANVGWAHVLSLSALAFVHASQGQVAQARRLADEAMLTDAEGRFTTGTLVEYALCAQALTAIDLGELAAARGWFEQLAHHDALLAENDAIRTHLRGLVDLLQDDPAAALRLLDTYPGVPGQSTPWHDQLLQALRVEALVMLDDLDGAAAAAVGLGEGPGSDHRGFEVTLARLLLAKGEARAAADLLAPLVNSPSAPFPNPKLTVHMLMLYGIASDQLALGHQALDAFLRATVLAERLGLNQPNARHARSAAASRKDVALTEAERNVVRHLSPDKTLGETADEMFISLNTLKTHLRRIYRKLGVENREEAIERARLMGLVELGIDARTI